MKHPLPPLDPLKVFECAARHLSFSEAAKELCITKGAVSYQVKKLEQALDVPLFTRSVRQVYLTEAGQRLQRLVVQVFSQLNEGFAQLKPQTHYDVVIAATTYVAARWLSPRVAKFLQQHPETSVQFEHRVDRSDFTFDEVDVAILWGRCDTPPKVTVLQTMPQPLFPVCRPDLAERLKVEPNFINEVTLLSEGREQDLWLEWFNEAELPNPRQVVADANVRVQAAIDGQGLILADGMMQAELDAERLQRPYQQQLEGYGYHLLSSESRVRNTEAQAMIKWLIQ